MARHAQYVDIHVLAHTARIDGSRTASVRLYKALPFKLFVCFGNVGRKVLRLVLGGEIVQLQKHEQQSPDPLALQTDSGVLPMSERSIDIDIFVGKVDAARIAHLAVDDGDLAVIAVIMDVGEHGNKGGKLMALDAEFLQFCGIERIDAAHAADIIVHEAHFNALFCLTREHPKDLVPELPFLNDEVLHENVFLGALQIGNEAVAERLAHREIFRFCIFIDERRGIAGQQCLADIRPAAHLRIQTGTRYAALLKLTGILIDLNRAFVIFAAGTVGRKSRIDGNAEQSKRNDTQDPRDLGLGNHVAVGGVDGGNEYDDPRKRLYDEDPP